jgi:hypothetical protein
LSEATRDLYPDWDSVARDVVGALRSAAGRKPDDRALSDLVGELSTRSEEFRQYTADPGTRSAEALALLGSLAATAAAEQSTNAP